VSKRREGTPSAGSKEEPVDSIPSSSSSSAEQQRRDDGNNEIIKLGDELAARDAQLKALQLKQQEIEAVVESLGFEVEEKKEYIRLVEEYLNASRQKVKDLEQELVNKQDSIELLLKEFSSALAEHRTSNRRDLIEAERFEKLARDVMLLESYNSTLKSTLYQKEKELDAIRTSVIYNTVKRISMFIDAKAPPNTTRRKLVNMLQRAIVNNRKTKATPIEQLQNLPPSIGASIGSELQDTTIKEHAAETISISSIIPELERLESINIDTWQDRLMAPKEVLPVRDQYLEQFLQYGSYDITKLKSYPLVSIIIATYDNLEDLKKNIESIEIRTTYPKYEVIIVTNNKDTKSEMRKYLSTITKHTVLVYEPEYSFAGVNNYASACAKGEFLLFLNDDTEVVEPQWVEALVKLMEKPSTGAVGGMMVYPDGTLQEAGGIVWGDRNIWNYGKFMFTPDDPNVNFVREVDYCSGGFLMVRKSVFDEIGGFNMMYHPAYCEDVDLCFAIRDKGYSVLYQPKSVIIHKEGATQGTDTSKGIKSYQTVNQKKFFERWSYKLEGRLPSSKENVFAERSRKSGKRILYIDHYVPMPDQDSGSLRTFYTLGILSWLGHDVTFWPENLAKFEPYTTELQQKGIEVILGPNNFEEFLEKRAKFFDVIILTRPHIAINFLERIQRLAPHCKIMYDTTDLHFLRMYRQAVFENDPAVAKEARHIKAIEMKLSKASTATFVVTKREAVILKEQDVSINPVILPNIHIPVNNYKGFHDRKNIYFIGGFQHEPNISAAIYLARKIFPLIKQEINDIKLFIVGSKPPIIVKELASKDIEVTGYVPDITPYLNNCRVMVAPLKYGAGLKGKITEATSNGLPVVTTDVGVEGTGLVDGESILIGNTAEEFAKKVIQVYKDEVLWNKISKGGYDEALKKYSPENIAEMFNKLLSFENYLEQKS